MRFNLKTFLAALVFSLPLAPSAGAAPSSHRTVHIFTTNDIHGHYFDSLYVGDRTQGSLYAVSAFINEQRAQYGSSNVLLLDGGDNLQGDNASYFFNYVDSASRHVYARMAEYMKYDALIVGNHDIEAGPSVYNRMKKEHGMPLLAANAIDRSSGKCHFGEYAVFRRGGLKIAVIGLTNPNMRNWLSEEKLDGMDFVDPFKDSFAQRLVDRVKAAEKPDVVVFVIHSGSGAGDRSSVESQGRDLLYNIKGVDVLVCAHDHRPYTEQRGDACLVNAGSHCSHVGHVVIDVDSASGKVHAEAETVQIPREKVDPVMVRRFRPDFEKVAAFSRREIGSLGMPLRSRDAYAGMCDYINFVHTVCLEKSGADISFAAPLKFNGYVSGGVVRYDDLQTVYPYENDLVVVKMTGEEIVRYLEASYDGWINTVVVNPDGSVAPEHILKIREGADPRSGSTRFSFVNRAYNFDSAAGIVYSVCVTAPMGRRVNVVSLSDGTPFDSKRTYRVAMTSYRYNGGGSLVRAAGLPDDDSRIEAKMGDIRTMVYEYFKTHGSVDSALVGQKKLIGSWQFVPQPMASQVIQKDLKLLFEK